jgi:hypothetical protein
LMYFLPVWAIYLQRKHEEYMQRLYLMKDFFNLCIQTARTKSLS